MKLLGLDKRYLEKKKGLCTAKEISQQPRIWRETLEIFQNKQGEIGDFINRVLADKSVRVIFTGAGSSAFVGESITPYIDRITENKIEAIATTDIVSNPENYLHKNTPTLLISFARSGNSPESVAAVELADQLIDNIYQIFVTCNPEGELAQKSKKSDNKLLIVMPEGSNDKGFAMTSSFTSMMLAGILLFKTDDFNSVKDNIETISDIGELIISKGYKDIRKLANVGFERIVYLGASSLKGLARESALKILELTRGKIVAYHNSPLGFRHGPKSIINDKTLIITFISSDEYTKQYDIDLLKEMKGEDTDKCLAAISYGEDSELDGLVDYHINLPIGFHDDVYSLFCFVMCAQIMSLYKSLDLGIFPDNPSPDGTVNRVVKGVNIYPYNMGVIKG